jgi:hypothetical protein
LVRSARRNFAIGKRVKPRNLDFDCPSCKARAVFRSRSRNRAEKFLRLTRIVTYCRCHSCGWRGRRVSVKKDVIFVLLFLLVSLVVLTLVINPPH